MLKGNWDDLRIVLAVRRAGSFAGAARILSVNESTVIRRLAQAEQRLRARLFDRAQGRLSPTEAGCEMVRRAERVEVEVLEALHAVDGTDSIVAGTVRLTSAPLLINRVLIPALPRLVSQYPGLELELIAEPRGLSLIKREADVALRLSRPHEEARTVARKVGELSYGVYAPANVPAAGLRWVCYEDQMSSLPQAEWISGQCATAHAGMASVRANDAEGLLACLQAGLGKTLLPVAVGDRIPGLVRLSDPRGELTRELWIIVHPDLRRLSRVRTVIDWTVEVCAGLTPATNQLKA
jgi:DNA-binding transcriptional LysR family regulator